MPGKSINWLIKAVDIRFPHGSNLKIVLVLSAAVLVLSEAVLESALLRVISDAELRSTIPALHPTGAFQAFEYEYRCAEYEYRFAE